MVGWWRYFVEMEEKEESREGGWGEKAGVEPRFPLFLLPPPTSFSFSILRIARKKFAEFVTSKNVSRNATILSFYIWFLRRIKRTMH